MEIVIKRNKLDSGTQCKFSLCRLLMLLVYDLEIGGGLYEDRVEAE